MPVARRCRRPLVSNERMMVEERRECYCTASCIACPLGRGCFLGFERRRLIEPFFAFGLFTLAVG
jgi:hypothetical protein